MNKKQTIKVVLICIVLIAVVIGGFLYISHKNAASVTKTPTETAANAFEYLRKNDPSFVQANYLRISGNYDGAIALYKTALANASTPQQEFVILTRLSQAYAASGKYADSIAALKSMTANQQRYSPIIRAYAVETMGDMYTRYGDAAITDAIFADQFKSLYVANDVQLSYKHLYEYAVSLYPLATAELNIANWYAIQLNNMSAADRKGTVAAGYIAEIQKCLDAANKDRVRVLALPRHNEYLHLVVLNATLVGKMSIVGIDTFGDAENTYKNGLNEFVKYDIPANDGRLRLQYAIYLGRKFGQSRASDIQTILAPLYDKTDTQRIRNTKSFLFSAQDNDLRKQQYVALSKEDPRFKTLLISYGWSEADFK